MTSNPEAMRLLIQRICDEVIKRLNERPTKTALVCFSGAAIGFKEAMDSLVKLENDGWQFKVLMSDNATKALDPEYIQKTLGVDTINTSSKVNAKELMTGVDEIILASTTINTAAKIAVGIADTTMLTIISQGLMSGTPITCAIDGACPDNEVRYKLGMDKTPPAYRKVMVNNLRALNEFGIKLCAADDLYDTCVGTPAGSEEVKGEAVAAVEPKKEASVTTVSDSSKVPEAEVPDISDMISSHIVSRKDIMDRRMYKTVKVKADALVTMYAKETAAEYDIEIVRA